MTDMSIRISLEDYQWLMQKRGAGSVKEKVHELIEYYQYNSNMGLINRKNDKMATDGKIDRDIEGSPNGQCMNQLPEVNVPALKSEAWLNIGIHA